MAEEYEDKQEANDTFKPVHIPFDEGIKRIKQALAEVGIEFGSRIITSRDADVVRACNLLAVNEGLPKGFTKWQLPFYMEGGQFFMTSAEPHARAATHSHPEDGVRFIMAGSIFYDGIELNTGDWMFLPKGQPYDFKAGPLGASLCYCYQCCCAPRRLSSSHQEVINPVDYVRVRKSLR